METDDFNEESKEYKHLQIIEKFDRYKNYVYSFFYFFIFILTFFVSFLIIFNQMHKSNKDFIFFYITFCIGLVILLGFLYVKQDLLSLITFFIYLFYSVVFMFIVLKLNENISVQNSPIMYSIFFIALVLFVFFAILLGEVSYFNNSLGSYIFLNLFSLLFLLYYYLYDINLTPSLSSNTNVSYLSFYKLYVFVLCFYYIVIFIKNKIQNLPFAKPLYFLFFYMLLILFLYAVRIGGKSTISLGAFIWWEYLPLFLLSFAGFPLFFK